MEKPKLKALIEKMRLSISSGKGFIDKMKQYIVLNKDQSTKAGKSDLPVK